jgi:hypothetical protein
MNMGGWVSSRFLKSLRLIFSKAIKPKGFVMEILIDSLHCWSSNKKNATTPRKKAEKLISAEGKIITGKI